MSDCLINDLKQLVEEVEELDSTMVEEEINDEDRPHIIIYYDDVEEYDGDDYEEFKESFENLDEVKKRKKSKGGTEAFKKWQDKMNGKGFIVMGNKAYKPADVKIKPGKGRSKGQMVKTIKPGKEPVDVFKGQAIKGKK